MSNSGEEVDTLIVKSAAVLETEGGKPVESETSLASDVEKEIL